MSSIFHRRALRVRVMLAAALLGAWAAAGIADALDGTLEVRSAYVNVDGAVFLLHARVQYPLTQKIRDALRDGITLTYDLDTRIERERRFWFDAGVVDLTLRRELAYHAVTGRYLVRDARSGKQESFGTVEEAVEFLGQVDGWPILVEPQLDGDSYRVSVRAAVHRGRIPSSLRTLLFWTDDWHRESEWYSWSLPV
jgi:hypothetical protein